MEKTSHICFFSIDMDVFYKSAMEACIAFTHQHDFPGHMTSLLLVKIVRCAWTLKEKEYYLQVNKDNKKQPSRQQNSRSMAQFFGPLLSWKWDFAA